MIWSWQNTLIVILSIMVSACGVKGPLIYPDMLVSASPTAVSALQSGDAVKLQFVLPDKDKGGRPLKGIAGIKISRRITEAGQNNVCRTCMTDYMPYQTIYLEHLPANAQRFGSRLILLDGDVRAGNSYSYSILTFTADGVEGVSLKTAELTVVGAMAAPVLVTESWPTEVKLLITSQHQQIGRLLGYSFYRSSVSGSGSFLPLNKDALKGSEYIDTPLERGVKYRYSARAHIMLDTGVILESSESDKVEGMLKDDE